jgi:phosphoribosylformimino-5-aminoimidazole carboxamide ribonucleotide (ProFAR) isomerase
VNLAATALRDPAWVAELVREHGDRIAVGIDVVQGQVVARGSGEPLGPTLFRSEPLLAALGPHRPGAFVVADASRDGRRTGVDLVLFGTAVSWLGPAVVASGGVSSLEDLRALRGVGVSGVVLGAALYHGAFTLTEALEAAR